jgi:hypothetical protein
MEDNQNKDPCRRNNHEYVEEKKIQWLLKKRGILKDCNRVVDWSLEFSKIFFFFCCFCLVTK